MKSDPRLTRSDTHIKTRLYVLAKNSRNQEKIFSCEWKFVEGSEKRIDIIKYIVRRAKLHGNDLSFFKVEEEIQNGYLNQAYPLEPCFYREISNNELPMSYMGEVFGNKISDEIHIPISQ